MDGSDIFAILSPCREKYWTNTIRAFCHPHNVTWIDAELIGSRKPTPAFSQIPGRKDDSADRFVLKFEQFSHFNEIQAGIDKKVCYILLKFPGIKAVSARQFVIVVRPDYTVFLEDRFSTYGTRVTYDGKEKEGKELNRDWILANLPTVPKRWNEVVICTGNVAYAIEFPNHAAGSSEYLEKLQIFRERQNIKVPFLGALDFHSNPITAAPSQSFTPHGNERPTYLHFGKIASSSFDIVEKILDTRNQKYYVKKTIFRYPRPERIERKRKRNGKTEITTHEA